MRKRLCGLLVLLFAAAANGQTRVIVAMNDVSCASNCTSQLLDIDIDRRALINATPFTSAGDPIRVVGMTVGDYVVLSSAVPGPTGRNGFPILVNSATGATTDLTQFSGSSDIMSDVTRARVYQALASSIRVIEPTGVASWPVCANVRQQRLAQSRSRLFVLCEGELVVVDTGSGTVVGRLTVDADYYGLQVLLDASRVFLSSVGSDLRVQAFDVNGGGAGPVWRPNYATAITAVVGVEARTRRVFVEVGDVLSGFALQVLDADSLSAGALVHMPGGGSFADMAIDSTAPRAAVLSSMSARSLSSPTLSILDTQSLAFIGSGQLPQPYLASWRTSVAFRPMAAAPDNLTAITTAQTVSLSWGVREGSPAVSAFVIEAGSAPGAANLATITVGGALRGVQVPGVPPGRYFTRIRAVSFGVVGPPSNEIEVIVP